MYQLIVEPLWEYGTETMSPSHEDFQDCSELLDLAKTALGSPTPVLSLHALQGL